MWQDATKLKKILVLINLFGNRMVSPMKNLNMCRAKRNTELEETLKSSKSHSYKRKGL